MCSTTRSDHDMRGDLVRHVTACGAAALLAATVVCGAAAAQGDADPIYPEDLTYPEAALRAGIQGPVVLQVDFDARGVATASTALSGPPALVAHSLANLGVWGTGLRRSTREILVVEYRIEQGLCHDDSQSVMFYRLPGLVTVSACRRASPGAVTAEPRPAAQAAGEERFRVVHFEDIHYSFVDAAALNRGVVVVELAFDDQGIPTSVSARTGVNRLREAAVANAKRWRFAPNPDRKAFLVYEFSIDASPCSQHTRSIFLLRHPNFAATSHCAAFVETH
jgi:hypothetical protein